MTAPHWPGARPVILCPCGCGMGVLEARSLSVAEFAPVVSVLMENILHVILRAPGLSSAEVARRAYKRMNKRPPVYPDQSVRVTIHRHKGVLARLGWQVVGRRGGSGARRSGYTLRRLDGAA